MFSLNDYWGELGGARDGYFRRNFFVQLSDPEYGKKINAFFRQYNDDCYSSIYLYDRKDIENSKLYGPFYLDLDGNIHTKKGFQRLKQDVIGVVNFFKSIGLAEDEIQICFSGSKGFHITIPPICLGIIPSTDLNALYKAWALYLYHTINIKSIDLVIYDKRRLFRVVGSVNSKTGLRKIPLTLNELWQFNSYEDLIAFGKNITPKPSRFFTKINKKAAIYFYCKSQNFYRKPHINTVSHNKPVELPKNKQKLLPCVEYLLNIGAHKGYRNNTLIILSSAIMQSGYKMTETLDLMHEWNKLNEPPLAMREIEITVRSAYSMLLSGKKYGCSAFKQAGYCIDNNCRIGEKNQ